MRRYNENVTMNEMHEKFEDAISSLSVQLRAAARAVKVRGDCSKAIISSGNERELLAEVCRILSETGGYTMIWAGDTDNAQEKIIRFVTGIGVDPEHVKELRLSWGEDEKGQSLAGQAIRSGRPASARRIPSDPDISEWRKKDAEKRGYASGLALPLISGDRVIGVLVINSADPDAFDENESELLAALAGDVAYGISALREKLARQEAEKALRAGRRVLLTMINHIPDTIFYKDAEGRYTFVNKAKILQARNYSPVKLIGRTVWDVYPGDQAQVFDDEDRRTLESEEGLTVWEEKIIKPDGSVEWRLNTKVAVRGPGGKSDGLITIGRDITAQKNAEALLKKSLEEKEILLQEIRHRTKNNLTLISSLLNLGMSEVDNPECRGVFLSAKNRLRSIVALYHHLERSESLNDVALHEYVRYLAETIFSAYTVEPGRIEVRLDLAETVTDAQKSIPLGLILNELLTNSLKFAFPEGRRGKVEVRLENRDGMATLTVSDDGVGLPEGFDVEDSPRMGLKLVQLLAEQIRGRPIFSGGPGRGTSVRLTFIP